MAKRYGSPVPRIFTPPLHELEPRSPESERWTLGYSVIDFAEKMLLLTLLPWQKWLLCHALELVEIEGRRRLRFRTMVVLVARQNGKSTLSKVLALWAIYVRGCRTVLTTAQDLDTAEEIWQDAVDLVTEEGEDDEPVRPALAALVKKVQLVNGKKALILESGERYKVKAANRKAGRGLTGDLVMLDELREHQNWSAYGALTKTTMARPDAQIWAFSNAGDVTSVVLRYLRRMAHEQICDPDGIVAAEQAVAPTEFDADDASVDLLASTPDDDDDAGDVDGIGVEDLEVDADDLFLAEWSAPPGCDVRDRDGWAWANPSLGWTIEERTIASSARTDPEWVFRTEVLCQWAEGTLDGLWPAGVWEASLNQPVEQPGGGVALAPDDRIVSDAVMCIAMSHDRSRTYIARCGTRTDGEIQVEIDQARRGSAWVRDYLMERRARIEAVTGQTNGAPVSDLLAELKADPTFLIPVIDWAGPDLAGWTGRAWDAVKSGLIRHNPQPLLDAAAAAAVKKPLGDRWVLDLRKSQVDAAPLQAFMGAFGAYTRPAPPPPPPPPAPAAVEAGEGRGLVAGQIAGLGNNDNVMTMHF